MMSYTRALREGCLALVMQDHHIPYHYGLLNLMELGAEAGMN